MSVASVAKSATRSVVSAAVAAARSRAGPDRRVLLYHRIEPTPRSDDPWSVSVDRFACQLESIGRLGYRVVDLDRARSWPEKGHGRELVIAFDDGYRSVLEHAAPLLRARGYPFVCFLVPGQMGRASTWEHSVGLEPSVLLDWADLDLLRASGATFGSHSVTHPDLQAADDELLREEIVRSRALLGSHGIVADAFSVPFGRDDVRIAPAMEAAGYSMKISNQLVPLGRQRGLVVLPCTAILREDDDREFRRKLVGAYDWLNAIDRRRYPPIIESKESAH